MDSDLDGLFARLRQLEEEFERTIDSKRAEFRYRLERNRVVFEQAVAEQHRRLRIGVLRFLRQSPLLDLALAPVIYSFILPFVMLDLSLAVYQRICFPIWGIGRVRRADYIVFDRHYLAYLNGIQKLNCLYCGYANGLIALVREVASRTEQYWCPIKHARRVQGAHDRYARFVDYGDAEAFRARLQGLRDDLTKHG